MTRPLLLLALLLAGGAGGQTLHNAQSDGLVEPVADPAVERCKTSCAFDDPNGERLTHEEFDGLITDWLAEPIDAPSLPLETLLFHGERTRELMAASTLPADWRAFLETELAWNTAAIEMRLIDDDGRVRAVLADAGFALGKGRHTEMTATGDLGHVEVSGRVKRVGLDHLWSRW
ncbi:MAG: hypothetical protein GY898_25560 [Proteobacteria bacterium]|nr:hypothetical protein [Pseudomonadota bacterium]